jgi:UDP-N-acetyl-D-glucosamine dehydrogenase
MPRTALAPDTPDRWGPEERHATRIDVASILSRIAARDFTIGIVGLGYVGLPLMRAATAKGFPVLGLDIDRDRVAMLNAGASPLSHVDSGDLRRALDRGLFEATGDPARLAAADAVIVCVPTPLDRHSQPDLSYVVGTTRDVAPHLKPGALYALESTTYPGTTRDVVAPILVASGRRPGRDVLLAFSPEREDPGNREYATTTIPKVVGADDPAARAVACALYGAIVERIVPVSSTAVAEAVKITENVFRAVNIALVNELKIIYATMGIDVWEVIEAAKSKPFGFMPFYPGPGLGGHCIPIDPFYLTWKAKAYGVPTRFIELAGEINRAMPRYVVQRLAEELDRRSGRGLRDSRLLVVGVAYKKNVGDTRESPALEIIELLRERGAAIDYHDPWVPVVPPTRAHGSLSGLRSITLSAAGLAAYDAAIVVTDHDNVDFALIGASCPLVIDTRNVVPRGANVTTA